MAKNALTSLWGKGHANTTRTRECVAMPGKREQEVLTSTTVLHPLMRLWGVTRPTFDPFGSARYLFAHHTALLPDDGQKHVWPDFTFGNPPYGELERAMVGTKRRKPDGAPYYFGHDDGRSKRWCFLVPVRSHRKWWREVANMPHVLVLELDPLKFVGFKQTFPAPLCLMFTGEREEDIEREFAGLGDLRRP